MAGLSSELRSLVKRYDTLQQDITRHQELLDRLETLVKARQAGNGRMQLPVELGLGYSIEGVVYVDSVSHLPSGAGLTSLSLTSREDTSKVIVNMGVDDLWAELEVGRALVFVKERIHLLEQ